MPPKFFITHSWQDIDFTRRLCDDLRAHGLDGFFDAYSIQPGDLISKRINDGLERCDIYVPILSHAALKSPWCEEEIHAAITLSKLPGRNGRPRIISILVEDCQDAMPILLRSRLYITFDGRYADAFNELLTKGFGVSLPTVSPTQSPPPKIGTPESSFVNPKTGKEMILIPAGEFVMGSNKGEPNEKPPHNVYLDAFYISRYPVTNAEYKKFVDATKCDVPFRDKDWAKPYNWDKKMCTYPQDKADHPVVLVSWYDAVEYCKWAEGRLPTEAEWEKAASWDDAQKAKRIFSWGDDWDVTKCNAEGRISTTTPVGKYSPQGDSLFGIVDMTGNVWEWCSSLYKDYPYDMNDKREDAKAEDARVLRGGSWTNYRGFARCTYRDRGSPGYRGSHVGFRVAESFPRS